MNLKIKSSLIGRITQRFIINAYTSISREMSFMIEYATPHIFLFATQAVAFLVLSFVFFMYYRTFSRQYVQYWLFSLLALTANYFIKAISLYTNITLNQNLTETYWQLYFPNYYNRLVSIWSCFSYC